MKRKPLIIVLSGDDDSSFRWLSGGWNSSNVRHTVEATTLMAVANRAIEAGNDVPDTIRLLIEAGFDVRRRE